MPKDEELADLHSKGPQAQKTKKNPTKNWRRDSNKRPARVKDAVLFKRAADRCWILTKSPFSEMLKEQLCCLRTPDGPALCDTHAKPPAFPKWFVFAVNALTSPPSSTPFLSSSLCWRFCEERLGPCCLSILRGIKEDVRQGEGDAERNDARLDLYTVIQHGSRWTRRPTAITQLTFIPDSPRRLYPGYLWGYTPFSNLGI